MEATQACSMVFTGPGLYVSRLSLFVQGPENRAREGG